MVLRRHECRDAQFLCIRRQRGDPKRGRKCQCQAKARDFHVYLPCRHCNSEELGSQGIEKMPGFPPLSQSIPKTCMIGIPFQATFAAISLADLHDRTWRNLCPLGFATKLLGDPDDLRQGGYPGLRDSAFLASTCTSRRRDPFLVRRHVASNADDNRTGSAGTRRDAAGLRHSYRDPSGRAWRALSRLSRSGGRPESGRESPGCPGPRHQTCSLTLGHR